MTRVLIVDDNPQNLYMLESVLKGYHFEVISTRDGVDALDTATQNPPDLVISDILMPIMDGFELCRRWKADEKLSAIPFIFYTATYIDPRDEKFALSLGAERFVIKPQKPEKLMESIQEVLEEVKNRASTTPDKPFDEEMKILQQYNEVLYRKLERKMTQLEREISEHKQVEEELHRNQENFRTVVDNVPDIVFVHHEGKIIFFNNAGLSSTGYKEEDVMNQHLNTFLAPEFYELVALASQKRRRGEAIGPYEVDILTKSGSRMNVTVRGTRIEFAGVPATLNVLTDITERKRMETALRESEMRYKSVVEDQTEFICRFTPDGRLTFINDAYCRYFGLKRENCLFSRHIVLLHPDDIAQMKLHFASLNRDNPVGTIEHRIIMSSGETRWQRWTDRAIFHSEGDVAEYQSVGIDITDQKKSEAEIKFRNVILSTQQESSQDGLLIVDENGKIISYNQRFITMWGIEPDLVASGSGDMALMSVLGNLREPEKSMEKVRDLYVHREIKSQDELQLKDGRVFDCYSSPMIGQDSTYYGRVWYFRDITEKKKAEEKINLINRKLALMNDITYQDIQNKVTVLQGYIQLYRESQNIDNISALVEKENVILESINHLIKNTKDYQKMGVEQYNWIPVDKLILLQWALISNKKDISLESHLRGLEINTDPLIARVFFNLIQNAIRHGKTLTRISFNYKEIPEGLLLFCEDDGVGIPFQDKPLIFSRIVGGVGKFGLFFVHEFLNLVGMKITETGYPGNGARFEISIPKDMYRLIDNEKSHIKVDNSTFTKQI